MKAESQCDKLPQHLLILRLAASCDVAMLSHAIRALRSAYPSLQITLATRIRFAPFFQGLGIDIMPVEMGDEPYTLRQKWQFVRRTKRIGVDAIADLHFIANSVLLGCLWRLRGVKVARIRKGSVEKWFRVGYSREGALHLKHTVIRYCDVFRRLGFQFDDPAFPQRNEADGVENCVGFAPFAAHSCCTCPEELRESIMERLTARFDKVYIFGGGERVQHFVEQMQSRYSNVERASQTASIAEDIEVAKRLKVMVSVDTLAMHIAALVATPVVSIWGATHPEFGSMGYGCDMDGIVQVDMDCRPCSATGDVACAKGTPICMQDITAEAVEAKIDALLASDHSKLFDE